MIVVTMSSPNISPVLSPNQTVQNLSIPPVAILLIGFGCYIIVLLIILFLRQLCRSKGICDDLMCGCCKDSDMRCCECCISISDACDCQTPTVDNCLDSCCPRRNLDCVGLVLCDCCKTTDCCDPFCGENTGCCGNKDDPCCRCGDMDVNCTCMQPDLNGINCLCCQCGTNTQLTRNNTDDD